MGGLRELRNVAHRPDRWPGSIAQLFAPRFDLPQGPIPPGQGMGLIPFAGRVSAGRRTPGIAVPPWYVPDVAPAPLATHP